MKIHNTINMCEQKCISEQYSNRANLLKREIEGILKNVHVYLEIHILKVYGQTGINNLLNHVVFFLLWYMIYWGS